MQEKCYVTIPISISFMDCPYALSDVDIVKDLILRTIFSNIDEKIESNGYVIKSDVKVKEDMYRIFYTMFINKDSLSIEVYVYGFIKLWKSE